MGLFDSGLPRWISWLRPRLHMQGRRVADPLLGLFQVSGALELEIGPHIQGVALGSQVDTENLHLRTEGMN